MFTRINSSDTCHDSSSLRIVQIVLERKSEKISPGPSDLARISNIPISVFSIFNHLNWNGSKSIFERFESPG